MDRSVSQHDSTHEMQAYLEALRAEFRQSLINAFKRLEETGQLEIMGGADVNGELDRPVAPRFPESYQLLPQPEVEGYCSQL